MSSILKGLSETKKDEKGFMPTPRQIPAPPGGHPVPPGYERVKSWGGAWELRKKTTEGEVVSMQARKTPLVIAGSPYDWNIYDLRTNQRVANILGGDRHDIPLYEIRIKSSGLTSTRMPPTYVLRAGPNNTPPYKAYELVAPEGGFGKIEKSPGPGGTTKLHPDKDDMLRHMMKNLGGGKYYGYDLDLVEEGLNQYQLVEKALGAKIMEIDDAIELGYTDWDPNDSSSIVYLGNKKNEGYSAGAVGGAGLGEEQAPMFTPEDKMVNANDPRSDGWRVYKAAPSGIMEGIIQEYDTKTIDQVVERLPKGLTVNNFTIPAFKEYLYNKYYETERQNWKELRNLFAQEYRQKHGIKEYKLGDLNHFDNMLLALPKGLSPEQIFTQGYKEFIYQKHGDKEWPNFKKNRFTYWDAYEKAGGTKPQGFFNKLKAKVGLDENLLRTYGDQFGLDEDVYTDSLFKEFLDSEYNKNQGSDIETLRNLGQFIRSKGMPEEKAKPMIRKLVAKLHPSGINEDEMALAELKCWAGYTRVRGVPAGAPGSCKKKTKESSIMKGIQSEEQVDEYKEIEGQRKIEFSKENPPDLYYLYQQFIQRMLNPENTIDPKDWIEKVNNHYGLNYSWKDYQKRGHNDHTDNWQKIINKYILKK